MIGMIEIASRITAIAEPKPMRLASPTMLSVTSTDSSSSPLRAVVDDVDDVERAQRLDHRDHDDDDVDRPQRREDDRAERLPLVGAVDRRRLAQRRVDGLQPGEVEDHDVADVAPAGGDEDRPQVDARVAEPVDQVPVLRVAEAALLIRPWVGE